MRPVRGMKSYVVGGAVRDEFLGLPVRDRDHVVIGATPQEMERAGYKPVGRDFPVFLHPVSKEEYALARTERKVGLGYKGFTVYAAPDVTLEQDLARRDLTINAMARDDSGALVDPFGGARDLEARLLRHVSPAFVEDPVRILRVARFAARFGFAIAPETQALMREIVARGEADALVAERVWQEVSKGLMERDPARMFAVLDGCGALARLAPELGLHFRDDKPADDATRIVVFALGFAAVAGMSLPVRFAILLRGARGDVASIEKFCERLRTPAECRDAALLAARLVAEARIADTLDPKALLALLESADAFRRSERLGELLLVAEAESVGEGAESTPHYAPRRAMLDALELARNVDTAAIARGDAAGGGKPAGPDVGRRIREARLAALRGTAGNT